MVAPRLVQFFSQCILEIRLKPTKAKLEGGKGQGSKRVEKKMGNEIYTAERALLNAFTCITYYDSQRFKGDIVLFSQMRK